LSGMMNVSQMLTLNKIDWFVENREHMFNMIFYQGHGVHQWVRKMYFTEGKFTILNHC